VVRIDTALAMTDAGQKRVQLDTGLTRVAEVRSAFQRYLDVPPTTDEGFAVQEKLKSAYGRYMSAVDAAIRLAQRDGPTQGQHTEGQALAAASDAFSVAVTEFDAFVESFAAQAAGEVQADERVMMATAIGLIA